MSRRPLLAGAAAALMAVSGAAPAWALLGGGYSVSGKPGPYIRQIADQKRVEAPVTGKSLALADDTLNRGQYQAALLRMPQTEARVRELLARIEAGWPYAKVPPVKVFVLGVDYYTAYSLPDGSIVVGFGLLDRARSDDEVAYVLAHELSHVRLGHFGREMSLKRRRKIAANLIQAYQLGASVHGAVRGRSVAAFNDSARTARRRAAAANDLLRFVSDVVIEPAWSRDQEDQADALGFDLVQIGSWSAETASARVFDTVQADADARRSVSAALESQLRREVGETGVDTATAVASGGLRGRGLAGAMLRGAGRVALGAAASSEGGPEHRAPEARKQGLADYSAEAYPEGLPLADEATVWLDEIRKGPEFRDARITVAAVAAAKTRRAEGDPAGAETEIAKALATSFRTAPMVINEGARVLGDLGDVEGADRLFGLAHGSPDQTVDGYLDHMRMFYEAGRDQSALSVAQDGIARYGNDEKPFLALQIAVYRRGARMAELRAALQRCRAYNDEDLRADCRAAAGGEDEAEAGPRLPTMPAGLPRFRLP